MFSGHRFNSDATRFASASKFLPTAGAGDLTPISQPIQPRPALCPAPSFFKPGLRSAVRLSGYLVVTLSQTSAAASRLAGPPNSSRRPWHSCSDEPLSTPQDRPGDSRQLVGEGDKATLRLRAFKQRFRPAAQRRVALSDVGQRRARSMDQLSAKVFVSARGLDEYGAQTRTLSTLTRISTVTCPTMTHR